jgi:hypothetical protein
VTTTTIATATESETIQIQLVFETAQSLLDEYHISIFERLTRDYLRLRGKLDVQQLYVLHQEMLPEALTLHLGITGNDVRQYVIQVFNEEWSSYLTFLRIGLDDVFFEEETATPTASTAATTSSSAGESVKDWKLFGMALTLSLLAIASVIVVRRTGRRRWRLWYKGHEYVRDPDDLNERRSTVTPDFSFEMRKEAMSSAAAMSEDLEYIEDNERERALSEESDSGWNSALSSMHDGGTTLSSIHEGGVEDYEYDYDEEGRDNGVGDYGDDGAGRPSSVVPASDGEGWICSPGREVQGVLIYV